MKTKTLLSLAALAALPAVGYAQYDYETTVAGQVNTPGPYLLSADIKVDFSFNAGILTVDLVVMNSTTLTPSQITGVYLLRPFSGGTMVMSDPTSVTTLDPDYPVGGPSVQWDTETSLDSNLAGYNGGNPVKANYFGVDIKSPQQARLDNGDTGTFNFTFSDVAGVWNNANDVTAKWIGSGIPLFYVRWQGVGDRGEDSGKGWGGPGFDDSVVPEPSAIAAMAALGLGGLLMVRRRLIRKQN